VRSLVESNSRVESVSEFRHESLEALATQSVMVCSYSKSVVYGYHKINIDINVNIKTFIELTLKGRLILSLISR